MVTKVVARHTHSICEIGIESQDLAILCTPPPRLIMQSLLRVLALPCLAAIANAQAFNWTLETPPVIPGARERTATGTDGTLYYMYGGQTGSAFAGNDELWTYDGSTWTLVTASGASAGTRVGAVGAFDIARGKFVVFGGQNTNGVSGAHDNDTWEWDATNGWINVTPAGGSPDPRWLVHNGIYVPGFGVIFHGGAAWDATGASYKSNETWLWTGGGWALLSSTGPTIQNAMMEYRSADGDLILHGGQSFNPTAQLGETWRFDLTTGTWSQLTTGGTNPYNSSNPAQGLFASMSYYNPLTGKVILHGGNGGSASNKTWELEGTDWTEISSNGVNCRNGGMHWIAALNKAIYGPCNEFNSTQNRTRSHGPQSWATTATYGSGCAGLGGTALSFAADNLPWQGATWTGTCTGMSAPAPIKLTIWGTATSALPITGLLGAGAGCTLLNNAALMEVSISTTTSFSVMFAIPASPSLSGMLVHLQTGELDSSISSLATSNGISLTLGEL